MTPVVGILGFQGCIEPHESMLSTLGVETLRVRSQEDLSAVGRLILPGGESTTMLRFINRYGMKSAIQSFAQRYPVWGICAGAILMAREVSNPAQDSLCLMDIAAHRNFYGCQLDSFTAALDVRGLPSPVEAQFIRAPLLSPLEPTAGRPAIAVESALGSQPVLLSQGHLWACSFHVELGSSTTLHEKFLSLEASPAWQLPAAMP